MNNVQFKTGYARVVITPEEFPITQNGSAFAETVYNDMYATCVAVSDGKKTALLITFDLREIKDYMYKKLLRIIEDAVGIPREQILMTATHNHSTPDVGLTRRPEIQRYLKLLYSRIPTLVQKAIADLTESEIYVSTAQTPYMNFVRRYLMSDGTYNSLSAAKPGQTFVRHETEADREARIIKFVREGKKDIVMVNWQCHPACMLPAKTISSDFVHDLRSISEAKHNVLVAFYQGGAGNINSWTNIEEYKQYYHNDLLAVGRAFGQLICDTLDGEFRKVEAGEIKTKYGLYTMQVRYSDDENPAHAIEIDELGDMGAPRELIDELREKYGFKGKHPYYFMYLLQRSYIGKTRDIVHNAISFGDVAFVSSPYEPFDANMKQVRDASPFEMTFTCGYANGYESYMPTEEAFEHGQYEAIVALYVPGTGERSAKIMIDLLNSLKNE